MQFSLANNTIGHASTRGSNPPSLGWMLLLAAALFALALPIVGPLDDHHFAERTHAHGHIYLNGRPVPHGHAYENGRHHLHRSAQREAGDATTNPTDGILYFTPATASLMLAVLSAPYHTAPDALRPPTSPAKNANPLTRYTDLASRPDGAHVPPPLPPPIA